MLGLPIGYSMIVGSIIYLFHDAASILGTSAEQILNGLYNSYVLLAVPLFLGVLAELMNVSKMTDHLLRFCDMLVGRFKGGLGHINIAQSIIFAGMSGSAIADLAGTGRISIDMMTRNNRYTFELRRRDHGGLGGDRAHHPTVDPDGAVCFGIRRLGRLSVSLVASFLGLLMAVAQMVINTIQAHRHNFPVEPPSPLRDGLTSRGRAAGPAYAGDPARRYL